MHREAHEVQTAEVKTPVPSVVGLCREGNPGKEKKSGGGSQWIAAAQLLRVHKQSLKVSKRVMVGMPWRHLLILLLFSYTHLEAGWWSCLMG